MRRDTLRRWTLRRLTAHAAGPTFLALAAIACGDTAIFVISGDGADAAIGDASEPASDLDAATAPPDAPVSTSDADVPDANLFDAEPDAGPGPAPAGFVQCGATTCDLASDYCCGTPDGQRSCNLLDGGPGCFYRILKCETKSDCPADEYCRIYGQGPLNGSPSQLRGTCLQGNVGFPKIGEAKPGIPATFQIIGCNPSPTPPYPSCLGGAPCIRQTCSGFVLDLCGEIPDGGCDPL